MSRLFGKGRSLARLINAAHELKQIQRVLFRFLDEIKKFLDGAGNHMGTCGGFSCPDIFLETVKLSCRATEGYRFLFHGASV